MNSTDPLMGLVDPSLPLPMHVPDDPAWYKPVGITLALASGFFIGSSFIFKKKGLLDSQAKHGEIGTGHSYLSSPLWWTGMILMALGEVANFGAYAFVPAILVTPLGALSVVISAILSSIFLKERLDFGGKVGCAQCLLGATIIVIHAPESNATETIPEFMSYVLSPGFLIYCFICSSVVLYLIYYVSPQYGDKNPLVYISICSTVGSFLVLSTQGFGSSVVYSTRHWSDGGNQFLYWEMYLLFGFIIFTVVAQIHFLNKALNLFSTAIVTPVYYVFFTTMTMISSAVLFRGFTVTSAVSGLTLVFGFLVIVGGVSVLFQYQANSAKASKRRKARRRALRRARRGTVSCSKCNGSGREKVVDGTGQGGPVDGTLLEGNEDDDDADEHDEDDEFGDDDDDMDDDGDDGGARMVRPPSSAAINAKKKAKKLEEGVGGKTNFHVLASKEMGDSPTAVNFKQAPVQTSPIKGAAGGWESKLANAAKSAASMALAWVPWSPTSPSSSTEPPLLPPPGSSFKHQSGAGQWKPLKDESTGHLDDPALLASAPLQRTVVKKTSSEYPPAPPSRLSASLPVQGASIPASVTGATISGRPSTNAPHPQLKPNGSIASFQRVVLTAPFTAAADIIPPVLPPPPGSSLHSRQPSASAQAPPAPTPSAEGEEAKEAWAAVSAPPPPRPQTPPAEPMERKAADEPPPPPPVVVAAASLSRAASTRLDAAAAEPPAPEPKPLAQTALPTDDAFDFGSCNDLGVSRAALPPSSFGQAFPPNQPGEAWGDATRTADDNPPAV
ncbi:hypothetical protein HDU96_006079 [Phlyctochytrium bullatum]|nr:hypothetical protein HDU96_006079 [Phlyctochytrium bullatum]